MEGLRIIIFYLAVPSLLFSAIGQILSWRKRALAPKKVFPGPTQFPVVGRVHDINRHGFWKDLKRWADQYGPVYRTSMMGQEFIVISDIKIAEEILVKRGHIYSGRAQVRALYDHKSGPAYLALMDRHDTWMRQRKWVHAAMADFHRQHFFGAIERETKRFLAVLLMDPAKFHSYIREHSGRIMGRLAWDDATQGNYSGYSADRTLDQMSISGPMVNVLEPLWKIPHALNPWRKYEREREDTQRAWWLNCYKVAKKRYLQGDLPETTWCHRYFSGLQKQGNVELVEELKDEIFASCMLGFQNLVGVITICGPMQFFFMAMELNPEWQKKAQEEIDRVCGDRMPTTADSPNLPTVRACLKEALRWRSGTPLGVPHQCEEDNMWRGELVKKGTIILAVEWNINRVPEMYPDPENYHPERYLEKSWPTYMEPLSRYPNFREGVGMHTFGFGRRTCLGQHIVDDEMFVTGAAVLWGFNLYRKKCPLTGELIEFDTEATNAHVILETKPFPCGFEPRSAKRAEQIMAQFVDVQGELRF
ncbi:cytochrome P450 [Microdochium trichocladiopsis]|uniref:Cytochrome P450 n=1 Tax=Microdochium trichocladiopsis TaxID=1682393 RepID=A0A9P9BW65_9PEZI|nr:cytochrome P450 [Microdochium trichocladiopsis]KAH7034771.1 cytochrome P450 [Microdochium trichocladiopsis]